MVVPCRARRPALFPLMTSTPLRPPAAAASEADAAMYQQLSAFQQQASQSPPVIPTLPAVLAAAAPAFSMGFAYTASFWHGELAVTLHYGNAEMGSSSPAVVSSYSVTCARLLAGLLGLPLADAVEADQPEIVRCGLPKVRPEHLQQQVVITPDDAPAPAPAEAPAPAPAPAPAEAAAEVIDDLADDLAEDPLDDDHDPDRVLTPDEISVAVNMIKQMDPTKRREFTKAFRKTFGVPQDAKTITQYITEARHLVFIDRYTVEAAGGIAP
jgi:hypothetical protein